VGAVVLDTDDIQELASPTNRWFTDTRARAAISAGTGISYNSGTGVITNAVTSGQIATALGYTPANPANVVPYTGATGAVDLGTNDLTSRYLVAAGAPALGGVISMRQDATYLAKGNGYSSIASSGVMFDFFGYTGASTYKNFSLRFDGLTDNTLRIYTLPNASGTLALTSDLSAYVPYTGATANLDLGAFTLLAAKGTFSSSGSADTVAITHSSGSGIALNISKAGNGEGIYVNKSSGSGNAVTIVGTLNATTLVRNGGTSSQFLKADGSVDSTAYLPLSGGTLTGELNASGIKIDGDPLPYIMSTLAGADLNIQFPVGQKLSINDNGATNVAYFGKTEHRLLINGSIALTVNSGGTSLNSALVGTTANFSGALVGTSATFSLAGTSNSTNAGFFTINDGTTTLGSSFNTVHRNANDGNGRFSVSRWQVQNTSGLDQSAFIGAQAVIGASNYSPNLILGVSNGASSYTTYLTIASTGAATFSSSVTADGNLTLINNRSVILSNPGTAAGSLVFFNATSATVRSGIGSFYNVADQGNLEFFTGGTSTKMIITSGGNVGIGTTAPATKLHIAQSSSAVLFSESSGVATIVGTNAAGNASQELSLRGFPLTFTGNGGGGAEAMRITSGGDVLVGATSAGSTEKFNVTQSGANWAMALNHTNSTQFFVDFRSSGTQTGSIIASGGVTSYNVTSDYRLKEDLKSINGLDIINKINIYDYKYKSSGMRMDGVLAHELAEVLPYAVIGVKDGEQMQQVDYSKIVPVMVQAIKDLKAKIETLENK
jgi:hypothetical protein